nr:Chain C, Peptide antigen YLEPAPVTA [synthetic construct]
YLEPAPVTA